LPLRRELVRSLAPPAALPAVPKADEDPVGDVDVAPTPSVDAEVPPTAALPLVPPVAADPFEPRDDPPLPMLVADCAKAATDIAALKIAARVIVLRDIGCSLGKGRDRLAAP